MEFREFTGKTVEDAIIEAATTLGIASSELDIEVVSKGTGGFLGIGAKPAVIKAKAKKEVSDEINDIVSTAKKPVRTNKKPRSAGPKKNVKTVSTEDETKEAVDFEEAEEETKNYKEEILSPEEAAKIDDSIVDETSVYLKKLFDAMELEADIKIDLDKMHRTMNIDVEGPDMGVIIGKRGQTLDALQYLISLFVNKKSETYIRIKLDTENYRERRKETLENLAKNIAYKVKKSRRAFTLEPMNPYERRIIHSTLQGDKFVSTRSEGEEPYRKVVVFPKKNGR